MSKITTNSILAFVAGGIFFLGVMATTSSSPNSPAGETTVAVSENPFFGEIMMFGGNFCPRFWARCDGQLLPISQNNALFSLLGTTYGGDGRTTFGLPDLRGRAPIGNGYGVGLPEVKLGQKGGTQSVTTVQPGQKTAVNNPNLGLTYCICLQGIYPSRN